MTIRDAVNIREIYRYMGYQGTTPDEGICRLTDEVLAELIDNIEPKSIYKHFNCVVEGNTVSLYDIERGNTEFTAMSHNLSDNLRHCGQVVLMAATLGIGADKLLNKYELINMTKASIMQACGAECIEAYCNLLQDEIRAQAAKDRLYLRPRFSAGYGDLALETQKDIFRTLECTKRIGLTLTQSLLMYPTKSVTAFIGLTKNAQGCHTDKCSQCDNKGCEYRND